MPDTVNAVTDPAQSENVGSGRRESRDVRSEKGEQTRAAIASAAQELFLERGYEKTTMRAVAERAGVSLGNAYYYFSSKEHLVQAFYDQIQREHAAVLLPRLTSTEVFAERLQLALSTWLDVGERYHDFADKFFKAAAEPSSPLSPFSPESEPSRNAAIAIHRAVLEGSNLKVPAGLRSELPELLWLAQMGMVLFWVYDSSDGQRRTRTLVAGIVPVLDRLLRLTRLPVVRGVVDDLVGLLGRLRSL